MDFMVYTYTLLKFVVQVMSGLGLIFQELKTELYTAGFTGKQ